MLPPIYQEIEAVTDRKTAVTIAQLFQGCQVYFPYMHGRSLKRMERDQKIVAGRKQGMSWEELSRRHGIGERRLREIIQEWARDGG